MVRLTDIPLSMIETFCQKHQVQRLSLFGSAVRGDFGPKSDVDVLVEFRAGARVGFCN